ncbi:MAG: HD domain-containing protein [Candidatus Heimdallarchaeota archaeon]|nr:HD domain-containing protein [Candidatus Heimdallarchaeota archaeon]
MYTEKGWPIPEGRCGLKVWRLNRIISIIYLRVTLIESEERELPMLWSMMHMFSTCQLSKLVALKRGLDPEFAALTCAFHDIYTFIEGKTEDHGTKAEKFIREIIDEYNTQKKEELPEISEDEIVRIIKVVKEHSEKNSVSKDSYIELLKDVDSLDSYLHGATQGRKSGRISRGNKLLKEFHIDHTILR